MWSYEKMEKEYKVVDELPTTGDSNIIYIVQNGDGYEEWVWCEEQIRLMSDNINYFTEGEWTKIGEVIPSETQEEPKEIPTNCKNCGAPLENGKCKYCGTEYR